MTAFTQKEREELEKWIAIIGKQADEFGLDPYPTHFEVVPQHVIYELGAYGLPARFSHWTFGRDYHRQKTSYEYGLSKIYEIVFNTDPCQAFLVEDNSMLSHKFVVAHVLPFLQAQQLLPTHQQADGGRDAPARAAHCRLRT